MTEPHISRITGTAARANTSSTHTGSGTPLEPDVGRGTHQAVTSYAPEQWLGTRLAQEILRRSDVLAHIETVCGDGTVLAPFAQLIKNAARDLDDLDRDAERLRARLADSAAHGERCLDGPYRDHEHALQIAARLDRACAERDHATRHLTRLLHAYQCAVTRQP
ncbi:hypothetical protein [Streptomyces sp. NPDC102360]|uniref:hypothetical protein n=1 Tax=Streptomyces sp. NPDC102360 TaxID=3366160 RepID=UPI00382C76D6